MDITFKNEARADAVAVMAAEGSVLLSAGQALDAKAGGALTRAMAATRFTGGAGQMVEIMAPANLDYGRVLVIGVGAQEKADALTVERWAGHAVKRTLASGVESLALHAEGLGGVAAAESSARAAVGAGLASYRFDTYRTKLKPEQQPTLTTVEISIDGPAAARARAEKDEAIVEGVFFARDLVSEPPNVLYPESFAERLRDLETIGVEVNVLDPTAMERLGMGAVWVDPAGRGLEIPHKSTDVRPDRVVRLIAELVD